jgi:hypothetical protein
MSVVSVKVILQHDMETCRGSRGVTPPCLALLVDGVEWSRSH